MADIIIDGRVRVGWVSGANGIANAAAPTTTELNSGMRLDALMTPDGLIGFDGDTAAVDTSSLSSSQNTSNAGRISRDGMALRLKRQDSSDTAFNTLTYTTVGFIVVRRAGIDANTGWTSAQAVAVYPVQCGEYKPLAPEANSMDRYEVPLFLRAVASTRAAIA